MADTIWLKQTPDKPLFEELLWSRPENKNRSGKLLIIGGNAHGFASPAGAYTAALQAGTGALRVLLPDSTRKTLKAIFPEAEFLSSTPSGSFSRQALDQLLENAEWADGTLLAGDFGRNSETAILLESFLDKHNGQITVAGDAVDYFLNSKSRVLSRENTLVVINLGKLQKLAKNNRPSTPIKHSMGLHELVTILADWTNSSPITFVTRHADSLVVGSGGRICTTHDDKDSNWQIDLAAYVSIWQLQNPSKSFEAPVSAIVDYLSK